VIFHRPVPGLLRPAQPRGHRRPRNHHRRRAARHRTRLPPSPRTRPGNRVQLPRPPPQDNGWTRLGAGM